jgi:hypothetical protein
MDLESRDKWVDYSKAKDEMFGHTDTKQSPWFVVNGDNKKRARLNCIHHLLSQIPYEPISLKKIKLAPLPQDQSYVRPPEDYQTFIPEVY